MAADRAQRSSASSLSRRSSAAHAVLLAGTGREPVQRGRRLARRSTPWSNAVLDKRPGLGRPAAAIPFPPCLLPRLPDGPPSLQVRLPAWASSSSLPSTVARSLRPRLLRNADRGQADRRRGRGVKLTSRAGSPSPTIWVPTYLPVRVVVRWRPARQPSSSADITWLPPRAEPGQAVHPGRVPQVSFPRSRRRPSSRSRQRCCLGPGVLPDACGQCLREPALPGWRSAAGQRLPVNPAGRRPARTRWPAPRGAPGWPDPLFPSRRHIRQAGSARQRER